MFLAICWDLWIWIAYIHWQKIFSLISGVTWKSRSFTMPFFCLLSTKPPSPRRSSGCFFPTHHLMFFPFLPPQLKSFWIFFFFSGGLCPPVYFPHKLYQIIIKKIDNQKDCWIQHLVICSALAEIKMSKRVSEGCHRKKNISGRSNPLFLLSYGSSVPSGLHTTKETPTDSALEGEIFSATSGKGGTLLNVYLH